MNKIIIVTLALAALFGCNSNGSKGDKKDDAADITQSADYKKGVDLVANNGCMTCHRVDEKITGPTYREVANKYAGASDEVVASLAQKIIKGGAGVWGDVMMIPHPAISEDDAKAMVKYILSLKK